MEEAAFETDREITMSQTAEATTPHRSSHHDHETVTTVTTKSDSPSSNSQLPSQYTNDATITSSSASNESPSVVSNHTSPESTTFPNTTTITMTPPSHLDIDANTSTPNVSAAATDSTTITTTATSKTMELQHPPPVRARSAYFIFAEQTRPVVKKDCPDLAGKDQMKELAARWSALPADEKQVFHDLAASERELKKKQQQEWLKWQQSNNNAATTSSNATTAVGSSNDQQCALTYPIRRIRQICKLDPDVRGIAPDALHLIAYASELALGAMARETVRIAAQHNRRTLAASDLISVSAQLSPFTFLREDLADLSRLQKQQHKQHKQQQEQLDNRKKQKFHHFSASSETLSIHDNSTPNPPPFPVTEKKKKGRPTTATQPPPPAASSKPLTAYFRTLSSAPLKSNGESSTTCTAE